MFLTHEFVGLVKFDLPGVARTTKPVSGLHRPAQQISSPATHGLTPDLFSNLCA